MTAFYPRDDVPIYQTAQDNLNRSQLTKRLTEAIQFASLPQVMGVEGDWGSGKTSLLQSLYWRIEKKVPRQMPTGSQTSNVIIPQEEALSASAWTKKFCGTSGKQRKEFLADENVRAVWFEAWRYQHEPEPVIALIHEIRSQLLAGEKWEQRGRKLWEKMKEGAEVFVQGLFASTNEAISSIEVEAGLSGALSISGRMPDVAKHVGAASAAREKRLLGTPLQSEILRKNLDLAISLFLGDADVEEGGSKERKRRLVIIVDDLDRCAPEAVCRLLESIKIHLDLPSCFFVLGLNRRHVETSLTSKLADAFHESDNLEKERVLRARASDYVEKICTNLVRIPRPSPDCCITLAKHCLTGLEWPDQMKKEALLNLADTVDQMMRKGDFVPLPSNPRRIKALCNQFQLSVLNASSWLDTKAAQLIAVESTEAKMRFTSSLVESIFIFSALRQFFPDTFRVIEASPRFYNSLRQWCLLPEGPLERGADSLLAKLAPIATSIAKEPTDKILDAPPTLLPDPHDGVAFFIQELVARSGGQAEADVAALISAL